jgi:hypothetical protein
VILFVFKLIPLLEEIGAYCSSLFHLKIGEVFMKVRAKFIVSSQNNLKVLPLSFM